MNSVYSVIDIETNALVNPSKIWCIVCKDYPSGKVHEFIYPDFEGFLEYTEQVDKWVAHNGIHFDIPQLNRLMAAGLDVEKTIDTLVLSRLIDYSIKEGHSLEAWGLRLGFPKIDFHTFDVFSQEMLRYCIRDVELTYKLFTEIFLPYYESEEWRPCIDLEHACAILAEEMSANGFPFDIDQARSLYSQFTERLEALDKEIISAFPPKAVFKREITPRATKHGTIHKGDFRWLDPVGGRLDLSSYNINSPFCLVDWIEFNPGSVKQIVDRMNAAGWNPVEKTKTHQETERELKLCRSRVKRALLLERLKEFQKTGWKVSEKNLDTLPDTAPEACKRLRERLILARRASTLEEWVNAYSETTGCVHGTFNTIGCWTHRFSHVRPNFANIVSVDKPFGLELRSLWRAGPEHYLVDVDAEGIQLRVLAHYMNDPVFIEALVNGDKALGTDAHSLNRQALGEVCRTRDVAKTFIYSWLLGAGVAMTAKILQCSSSEARQARENFEDFYPGLKHLRQVQIPADASRGYFIGFDGRKVKCDSEHKMLSGYLQNGEAVIMKTAWTIADKILKARKLPFKWVNLVHDEYIVITDNSYECTSRVWDVLKFSIKEAGRRLNLNCPMAGSGSFGVTWAEVH